MSVEQEVAALRAERDELRQTVERLEEQVAALVAELAQVGAELAVALEQNGRPGQGRPKPPEFVKPNRAKAEASDKRPRRKRAASANAGRKRAPPTKVVRHGLERCPTCEYKLTGESVARRRQVVELPQPQPVEVIEHQVLKRWCPHCQKWQTPKLDLRGQVLGQGRFGVRVASVVAYLRTELRLPIRGIVSYLHTMHRLRISAGEVAELLQAVSEAGQPAADELLRQVRASAVVHADETGWREDGRNGYVWAWSTADGLRYYEYEASRAGAVVERTLGESFQGLLVSDFYGGYNAYSGRHQRCWVHLLRDLHELKQAYPDRPEVQEWAKAVRALFDQAQKFVTDSDPPSPDDRQREYGLLLERVERLGLQYAPAQSKTHPCWALAKRLMRHSDELFQFVLVEHLPPDNNLAERSIRPLVVVRKISGGSRSSAGSKTCMVLASLFGTWLARGLNALDECLRLLSNPPLPQI